MRVDVKKVSNRSALEALWVLGALEPRKWLKRARRRVLVKRVRGLRNFS